MMNTSKPDPNRPEHEELILPAEPMSKQEAEDVEDLLDRVVEETLDLDDGKAFFPVIARFAQLHPDGDITEPQLAAELIHEVLDYRFDGRALPVNCHHWVAHQMLSDDRSRERLQLLWQRALNASG